MDFGKFHELVHGPDVSEDELNRARRKIYTSPDLGSWKAGKKDNGFNDVG